MRIRCGLEADGQIGLRQQLRRPLRPLDEPQTARPRPLAQTQMLELARVAQPIEIEVHERQGGGLMHVHQCVGRAAHRRSDAAGTRESPCQGGLARAEIACQVKDARVRRIGGPGRAEPSAEGLGLLR
jgi:hypothetical protein